MSNAVVFNHVFTVHNTGKLDDSYHMDKKALGEGSYGTVARGTDKSTGVIRAVKAIQVNKVPDPQRFADEVSIQQSLDHPHIVKLYEVFKDARCYYLVMELCTGGELFDRIVEESERNGEGHAFDEVSAAQIMSSILGAMRYLHEKKICHRDIKPENFLMQSEARDAAVKVIDFGLAKHYTPGTSELHTKAGTPYYVAPEVILSDSRNGYNEKCDLWSLGVLTYIILCGYPPFYGDTDSEILRMVKKSKYDYPSPDWDGMSPESRDFIDQMLTKNKDARPSAEQMLEHKWLKLRRTETTAELPKNLGDRLTTFRSGAKLKKVALSLIAQQMNESEIQELKKTFQSFDKNNDGTLTAKEIQTAMEVHKLSLPKDVADVMASMDTDGSGSIDYTEFIAATLTQKQYTQKDVLWSAFRVFDIDGSGAITADELTQVLKDVSAENIQSMISEVDLNKDNKINFEEFCAMMKKIDNV